MIEIEHLTKRYGSTIAVSDLSLRVAPGELYALLGPNGAGKSTTLACLLGFAQPDAGRLVIDGIDVATDLAGARSRIAYIPEQVSLYDSFSGSENVSYFAALAGRKRTDHEVNELLAAAGLQQGAHGQRVATYSKGMRQKVGIAIALAKKATVLLLDEPTSGLDPASAHDFSNTVRKLRDDGASILMATHDLFRTIQDADRIGILIGGKLVDERATASLSGAELERVYVSAIEQTRTSARPLESAR